ncbi:MAG: 4-alpha-glucanotransferase [Clostridiales Family XIII bacterium]|jgi:4-alpha-glucanotransferase|nr:4-alpha-glucanotransferase [Clostridiales Family XIII bacterium]
MGMKRKSGILLPIFSLPSPYGIGTLGRAAYDFADFLAEAGQRLWQILPIGATAEYNSPYRCLSAFAGNPFFIDLDILLAQRRIDERRLRLLRRNAPEESNLRVNYDYLAEEVFPILVDAASTVGEKGKKFSQFRETEAYWLRDYASFMENRMPSVTTDIWERLQFLFFEQWDALHRYVNQKGIQIIGDIPYYVSEESADYRANPALFKTFKRGARQGQPSAVSGVPPDQFSANGQVWTNPVYDWAYHKNDGYRWWLQRLSQADRLYDYCRIDHFRGFSEFFSIPIEGSAADGKWVKGPGMDFIHTVQKKLPGLKILAEDLGILSDHARKLLSDSGYPDMIVLQFAFDPREESTYLPHNHHRNAVVYTGTHDNNTLEGWISAEHTDVIKNACMYLGVLRTNLRSSMIRATLASIADTAIIPLSDYLGLGADARLNTPSTVGPQNWSWRVPNNYRKKRFAATIRKETERYGRGQPVR